MTGSKVSSLEAFLGAPFRKFPDKLSGSELGWGLACPIDALYICHLDEICKTIMGTIWKYPGMCHAGAIVVEWLGLRQVGG